MWQHRVDIYTTVCHNCCLQNEASKVMPHREFKHDRELQLRCDWAGLCHSTFMSAAQFQWCLAVHLLLKNGQAILARTGLHPPSPHRLCACRLRLWRRLAYWATAGAWLAARSDEDRVRLLAATGSRCRLGAARAVIRWGQRRLPACDCSWAGKCLQRVSGCGGMHFLRVAACVHIGALGSTCFEC